MMQMIERNKTWHFALIREGQRGHDVTRRSQGGRWTLLIYKTGIVRTEGRNFSVKAHDGVKKRSILTPFSTGGGFSGGFGFFFSFSLSIWVSVSCLFIYLFLFSPNAFRTSLHRPNGISVTGRRPEKWQERNYFHAEPQYFADFISDIFFNIFLDLSEISDFKDAFRVRPTCSKHGLIREEVDKRIFSTREKNNWWERKWCTIRWSLAILPFAIPIILHFLPI